MIEEQRRRKPEYLKEERRDQNLADDPAVAVYCTNEPAQIEHVGQVAEGRAAREQDDPPGPGCFKLLTLQLKHTNSKTETYPYSYYMLSM